MSDLARINELVACDKPSPREWWPAAYADEVMPPGKPRPDDFIVEDGGRLFVGYRVDEKVIERDRDIHKMPVAPGDIVAFICCDDLGAVDVIVNADGTFQVEGEIPPRATHFMSPGDVDSLASSIEEFAANAAAYVRDTGQEVFPFRDTCRLAWWSDEIPHKLVKGERLTFEIVSAAEARQ